MTLQSRQISGGVAGVLDCAGPSLAAAQMACFIRERDRGWDIEVIDRRGAKIAQAAFLADQVEAIAAFLTRAAIHSPTRATAVTVEGTRTS